MELILITPRDALPRRVADSFPLKLAIPMTLARVFAALWRIAS
jgi:hypothetical protein